MWIDPDRQIFVILLTNRVHPTRENNLIREVRPAVADAVVRALYADASAGQKTCLGASVHAMHTQCGSSGMTSRLQRTSASTG